MLKKPTLSLFNKNGHINGSSSTPSNHFQQQLSPISIKDLRRLVLDKNRKDSFETKLSSEDEPRGSDSQRNITFNYDLITSPKSVTSPKNLQIRNQQRQQFIKDILLSQEPIDLQNKTHNDALLEVMKKAIKNKEEISFIQHFLKNVSYLQVDMDFYDKEQQDCSSLIYPYVSYSSFQKGETIYNSRKVAQFNDTHQNFNCKSAQKIPDIQHIINSTRGQQQELQELGDQNSKKYQTKLNKLNRLTSLVDLNEKQHSNEYRHDQEQITIPDKEFERVFVEGQSFGDIEIMTNQTRLVFL